MQGDYEVVKAFRVLLGQAAWLQARGRRTDLSTLNKAFI
jgi:hypothetical protein